MADPVALAKALTKLQDVPAFQFKSALWKARVISIRRFSSSRVSVEITHQQDHVPAETRQLSACHGSERLPRNLA